MRQRQNQVRDLGTFTNFSDLPPASSVPVRSEATVTNMAQGGAKLYSTGTYWRPINGNISMLTQGADITVAMNSNEQIFTAAQVVFPANFLQVGCVISLWPTFGKTSSTDTASFRLRFGPLGTTADPAANAQNIATLATTNLSIGGTLEYQVSSATQLRKLGSTAIVNPMTGFSGTVSTTTVYAPTTFGNINTDNTLSITCQMTAGTETASLYGLIVEVSFP